MAKQVKHAENNYLEQLHKEELQILKYVTQVCDELNLKYVLYAGTLLGAIRHKGFIPWDDDIDIAMPREDYEIFLKKAHEYLPKHLFVQHFTTEPTNILWIKVRNKNTLFLEQDNQNMPICHGIFIDIFPFDRINNNKLNYKIEFYKLKFFTFISSCYSIDYVKGINSPLNRLIAQIIYCTICKLIPVSKLLLIEDNRRKKRNLSSENYYMIHAFENKGIISYDDFFKRDKYQFEDSFFWGSYNYDSHLTKMYGNYMQIPPKDKQVTHNPISVKFHI